MVKCRDSEHQLLLASFLLLFLLSLYTDRQTDMTQPTDRGNLKLTAGEGQFFLEHLLLTAWWDFQHCSCCLETTATGCRGCCVLIYSSLSPSPSKPAPGCGLPMLCGEVTQFSPQSYNLVKQSTPLWLLDILLSIYQSPEFLKAQWTCFEALIINDPCGRRVRDLANLKWLWFPGHAV